MDMISVLNDCSVKCYGNVKSKEGPILFQKLIAKSIVYIHVDSIYCESIPNFISTFFFCIHFLWWKNNLLIQKSFKLISTHLYGA